MTNDSEWASMIFKAVKYQSEDTALWNPETATESYVVQALRDLHRVIEEKDKNAFKSIKENAEDTSDNDLSYIEGNVE